MTAGVGPLADVRVLDLSALAPGPFATMLLGDLGADVVTVEPPPGVRGRSSLEDLPQYGGVRSRRAGINPLYRSRRSVVVDLKQAAGRDLVLRLAEAVDVFLEGFRPGVCDRLGLGYEQVAARNPTVVYCSLTGYGQDGELAQRAGHDLNYIAEAGLLSVSTRPGQRPGIPLNVGADFAAGGLLAAFGILAALRGRASSGRGSHVDVSMYEGLLGLLQPAHAWTAAGATEPSWGLGLLSGGAPFYDCYRTADGRWLSVGALEPKFYANLCTAIGRPDLIDAHTEPSRWDEVRAAFEDAFAADDLDVWLARLAEVDTAVAPVRSIEEAFAVGRRYGLVDSEAGVDPLPRMRGWNTQAGPVVAHPGAHSREVLAESGLGEPEIQDLLAAGVVHE